MAKLLNKHVIETEVVREHEEWNCELDEPVITERVVKQYWTVDGVFLAEADPLVTIERMTALENSIDYLTEMLDDDDDDDEIVCECECEKECDKEMNIQINTLEELDNILKTLYNSMNKLA